ncbi:methylated-DNA--[protein]-cysteine S-methyltransferase [Cellulomonas sp. NS3]|uniref:methylated-DNA--[protein]-cysteine S-methyltransferase n=1 Tax=Cellulomonas sp. NS3 TaxID=2973977 RepID=UPI002161BD3A|nr:methylated-DNA--[protein]-cysteine S-methyltransferase [Cellulomonas sp. NS3]
MTTLLATILDTPAGALTVVLDPDGVVRVSGFGPFDETVERLSAEVRADGVQRLDPDALEAVGPGPAAVVDAVRAYADGHVGALDTVPVAQPGGPFQQELWRAMRAVPPGATVSYTALAAAAGRPAAVRAAGGACARNLVAPFVPCHRIVRSSGQIGGYYFGPGPKRALLAHEEAARGATLESASASA